MTDGTTHSSTHSHTAGTGLLLSSRPAGTAGAVILVDAALPPAEEGGPA